MTRLIVTGVRRMLPVAHDGWLYWQGDDGRWRGRPPGAASWAYDLVALTLRRRSASWRGCECDWGLRTPLNCWACSGPVHT